MAKPTMIPLPALPLELRAKGIHINYQSLYRRIQTGAIPATRLGMGFFVERERLAEIIASLRPTHGAKARAA